MRSFLRFDMTDLTPSVWQTLDPRRTAVNSSSLLYLVLGLMENTRTSYSLLPDCEPRTDVLTYTHSVFGRATSGFETIHDIENARTDKGDKPFDDIKIVSIDIES